MAAKPDAAKPAEGAKVAPTFKEKARAVVDARGDELAAKVKASQGKESLEEIASKTTEGKIAKAVFDESERNFAETKKAFDKGDYLEAARISSKNPANPAMPLFIGANAIVDAIEKFTRKAAPKPEPKPKPVERPPVVIAGAGIQIFAQGWSDPSQLLPLPFAVELLGVCVQFQIVGAIVSMGVFLEILDGGGNALFTTAQVASPGSGTTARFQFFQGMPTGTILAGSSQPIVTTGALPDRIRLLPNMLCRLSYVGTAPSPGDVEPGTIVWMVDSPNA